MTTLITGARGTIGAGLVRRLHDGGHDVRAASRAPDQLTVPESVPVHACAGARGAAGLLADAPPAPVCAENSVTRIAGRPGRTFGRWASQRLDAFR